MWPCCVTYEVGKHHTRVGAESGGPGCSIRVKTPALMNDLASKGSKILFKKEPTSHMNSTNQNKNAGLQSK